jgi:hypothetical membrane protein
MITRNTISIIGITGVLLFIIAVVCGALLIPGYSHLSQYISESYAIDTKYGIYLRLFGYIPSGILMMLFCFFAVKHLPKNSATSIATVAIGLFYGGGTLLTGIFPCDAGCNKEMIDPSLAQFIHNLSGLLTYITVPFFVIILGFAALKWQPLKTGKVILLCGFVSLTFLLLFFSQLNSPYGGLYQRILEGSILTSLLVTARYIKNYNHQAG